MYVLVSRILEGKDLIGYAIYNTEDEKTMLVPVANASQVIRSGKVRVLNATTDERGRLIGTNGSLDRLPSIDRQFRLLTKSIITILNEVVDRDGELLGYDVLDFKGTKGRYRTNDVITLIKRGGISNGKLVDKGNSIYISCITGTYPREVYVPSNSVATPQREVAKPVVEQPKQVVRQVVEQPKQVVEQPKQVVRQVVEQPKQVVEKPKPAEVATKPVVEQPKQVEEVKGTYEPVLSDIERAKKIREEKLNALAARYEQKQKEAMLNTKTYDKQETATYVVDLAKTNKVGINKGKLGYHTLVNSIRESFEKQSSGKVKVEQQGTAGAVYVAGNYKIAFNSSFMKQIRINKHIKVGNKDAVRDILVTGFGGIKEFNKSSELYNKIIDSAEAKFGNIDIDLEGTGLRLTTGLKQLVIDEMNQVIAIIGIKLDPQQGCSVPKEKADEIAQKLMEAIKIA